MSCDEPVALFMRESIIVITDFAMAAVDMCAFHKRSGLYYGLFNDCLTVCFSLLFCISYSKCTMSS